ncbi:HugZ family pyridoxamine 5'-phosphate oxidase [Acuticoccus sediminis]|uniref:HugZ family pyridoxamine 5'-phosphate oxidase n=1 Tax=Acuticoccus sediminis TaxID=2184697 RepID=UPI001CFCC9F4|nr:DUF2470 domain-containing protein [Acuticoccus sediminis]
MNDLPFAARMARNLIHVCRDGALATLDTSGHPHASHVATATMIDGAPLLLVSALAVHTQNMQRDARASLLFVSPDVDGDTNTRARVSLVGDVAPVDDADAARMRFLRRHPDAAMYAGFADFGFWRFTPRSAHLVAGFGRITDLAADDLLAPAGMAAALASSDEGAVSHMNSDHADALKLMAEVLAEAPEGEWQSVGIDPLGIDMVRTGPGPQTSARVEYDEPVGDGMALRKALVALTKRARASLQTA